jgi:hypothetical protein
MFMNKQLMQIHGFPLGFLGFHGFFGHGRSPAPH